MGRFYLGFGAMLFLFFTLNCSAHAGMYSVSAHGDSSDGVNRTGLCSTYSRGNCAHCHEQHASIDGAEPEPMGGAPSPFAVFSDNFNSVVTTAPYTQEDNFCFYCHVAAGGLQTGGGITNRQYSNTFGGYTTDSTTDILGAFNLGSYHNLKNIQEFAAGKFSFFQSSSNPCVACHNPHMAKRNKEDPGNPNLTAISKPSEHESLWGDDASELMSVYTTYRSPYYYGSATTYEPAGDVTKDGSNTPDYNAFCLDCHQYEVPSTQATSLNPNTTPGYLTAIDWSATTGDEHGGRAREFGISGEGSEGFACNGTVIAPYNVVTVESNYVLSCLDCHEPHGSVLPAVARSSSYLLRKEVNGNVVDGCGSWCEVDFCQSCHTKNHAGPQGCLGCHYHGARDVNCGGPRTGWDF